jgi:hypothetical protein
MFTGPARAGRSVACIVRGMEAIDRTRIPHRHHPPADRLSGAELQRELTLAVAARTRARQSLFDTLYDELQRRRRRFDGPRSA